jgi:steroid delta-isomerase-like uncharacterized protein
MTENEQVVRRYLEAVWGGGDAAAVADLVDARFSAGDELAVLFPPPYEGPAGVQKRLQIVRDAFGDLRLTINDIRDDGDRVTAAWTITCVHRGMFLGYPPTGRQVTVTGNSVFRLREGKIVERRGRLDRLGLIRQLQAAE